MKPRIYEILNDCIERGIRIGIARSLKHTDKPSEESQAEQVHMSVMTEIGEYFEFDSDAMQF